MATLIGVDGTTSTQAPTDGIRFTLSEFYALTGAETIEIIDLSDGGALVIDEDGKVRGLPVNPVATSVSGLLPYDIIVGPALRLTAAEVRAGN